MELIKAINKTDISLIEGENKLGKLTFALYTYGQNESIKKITILSSIPKKLLTKRLNSIKNLKDKNVIKALENIEVLCLKENWLEIKSSYGFDFIYDDIGRIVKETNCDAIIFHRPDLMFSEGEYEFAKLFIEKFIEIVNTNSNKHIFITADSNHFLTDFLENYTDISLFMKKQNYYREITINHSLYPINFNHYDFIYENNSFMLKMHKEKGRTKQFKTTSQINNILVISKDERFKKLNKFILEKTFNIDFAENLTEVINKLENLPDIVIYQQMQNIPDFNICSVVKEKSPNSEIITVLNKNYVRTEDKTDAMQSHCYEVFPKNFNLEEYILSIEKINHNFFYSNKIKLLPPQKISPTFDNFCKSIKTLNDEHIFFSFIKTKNFNKEIINKLRNHDIIYIDEYNNLLYLCLIDVTKEIFETSLKQKLNFGNYTLIESIEWDGKC